MINHDNLREKKLRGSGGFVMAAVSDEEQKLANLGGPELFLAGVGRLQEDRFSKYHCNKCEKDYDGSPELHYENPNEDLGEGVTLLEKGEYKCKQCGNILAQYRKFDNTLNNSGQNEQQQHDQTQQTTLSSDSGREGKSSQGGSMSQNISGHILKKDSASNSEYTPISALVGLSVFDSNANYIGKVNEIGLRRTGGSVKLSIKISQNEIKSGASSDSSFHQASEDTDNKDEIEVPWGGISKISDIVLLAENALAAQTNNLSSGKCPSCGYQNQADSQFCEDCGTKL